MRKRQPLREEQEVILNIENTCVKAQRHKNVGSV